MGNIINRVEFIERKKELIITSSIASIIMFFVMGNWNMISLTSDSTNKVTREVIINKCFSLSYLNIFLLYLICAVVIGVLFRNKEEMLEYIVENKSQKNKVFFTKVMMCIVPVIISVVINLLIKSILYFVLKGNILERNGIDLKVLGVFALYIIVITVLLYSILLLLNIAVKDSWIATLIPCFVVDAVLIMFGFGVLVISNKLSFLDAITKPIQDFVLGVLELIYLKNGTIDYLASELKVIGILFIISILLMYVCYVMVGLLNSKNIKKDYVFGGIRHIFYLSISCIVGYCFINGLGYIYLISTSKIEYDEGLFYINIGAFLAIIVLYVLLNIIYKFRMKSILSNLNKEEGNNNELENSTVEDRNLKIDEEIEESIIRDFLTLSDKNNHEIEAQDHDINEEVEIKNKTNIEIEDEIILENPGEDNLIKDSNDETTLAERIYADYILRQNKEDDVIESISENENKLPDKIIEEIIIQKEIEDVNSEGNLIQE